MGYEDPSGNKPCQEKQDLYKKYREQGMTAQEANISNSIAGDYENTESSIKPENTATVPQGASRAVASQPSTKHQKDISQSRES